MHLNETLFFLTSQYGSIASVSVPKSYAKNYGVEFVQERYNKLLKEINEDSQNFGDIIDSYLKD